MCYDFANDFDEMVTFSSTGRLISNHSYGDPNIAPQPVWTYGAYQARAAQWDLLCVNQPKYLPFAAAGNEQTTNNNGKTGVLQGYDVITAFQSAKNVMTIGAVNANRSMSNYSCFGPMDDGRIKPDVCARGTGINSAQSSSNTAYSGSVDSDGTSYSTPAAAAAGLLLQQYYFTLNNSYIGCVNA